MKRSRRVLFLLVYMFPFSVCAQINTDRVMLMGRNALYYEDYVLSIQRFNVVIAAKPYLSEPYFYRGLAKFYLEDYAGADDDCTIAIDHNPFLPDNYRLRGLCRINLQRYEDAVSDYEKLLDIEPQDETGWHNMVLCRLQLKEYGKAVEGIREMLRLWPRNAKLHTLMAQACFAQNDTVAAMASVDHALEVNPYEGAAWSMRAMVYANRGEYKEAEDALDRTIQQMPREADNYINRALARYHQRNLRGAMSDYDTALELDSSNYIGHFNRGLLRAQVGDDNRAIEDFNFVLRLEPDNMIALFNRALMMDNTGDYNGALRDINAVIKEYPNFWTGYQFRASVRRKIGDTKGAELDEFKVLKAQMDQRYGGKKPDTVKRTRKQSDRSMEDYNKLVEADNDTNKSPDYESAYRGKVQNRKTELAPEAALALTYYSGHGGFQRKMYYKGLERLNRQGVLPAQLLLGSNNVTLDAAQVEARFASIGTVSEKIARQPEDAMLYFSRAIDEYLVQDFENALLDADRAVSLDSTFVLAYFVRMQVRMKEAEVRKAEHVGAEVAEGMKRSAYDFQVECQAALEDCERILATEPEFAACYYNKGNIYMQMKSWALAAEAYTQAVSLNSDFAEAYYNRGIAHILSGDYFAGITDLSRAGELGLYGAYNLIKRYRDKTFDKSK